MYWSSFLVPVMSSSVSNGSVYAVIGPLIIPIYVEILPKSGGLCPDDFDPFLNLCCPDAHLSSAKFCSHGHCLAPDRFGASVTIIQKISFPTYGVCKLRVRVRCGKSRPAVTQGGARMKF